MRHLLLALLTTFALGACFQHTVYMNEDRPSEPGARLHALNHQVLWGIIDASGPLDLDAVCPEGAAAVHTEVGPLGVLLGLVTAGIYVPTRTDVFCVDSGER
ncbi:MAG: hypothetical protein CVU56_00065 [Deltaproteobacteria bacterium HGW-Deltaproteobacteria-14]|jgi:hypothetical protein|nr:MAG: hypothetical protein CVU56_00065 [Deltaproteobacteria bacterium HGW-Deltaproteobacteria-14]